MKLIYLPTGKVHDLHEIIAKDSLKFHPAIYIRAELPEYWRVEGYDKSWEWFGCPVHLDFVGIDKQGEHWASNDFRQDYPQISRAEFEYHIYNPWKREQTKATGITSEDYRKLELEDLRAEAEKMGYELVRKLPVKWETDFNWYEMEHLDMTVRDKHTNEIVSIPNAELENLIEKYTQFKNI